MSLGRSRFSQELCDIFIVQNEGDEHTLRACALVCHSWLYTSRTRLFSSLRIDDKSAKTFNAAYPTQHASFIRTLHIGCHDTVWRLNDNTDITQALIALVSFSGTHIQSLRMERISLRLCQDPSSVDLVALHSFTHISKLEILSGDLDSYAPALNLLKGFQNTKSLLVEKRVTPLLPGEPNDHPDELHIAWEEIEAGYALIPLLGYIHSLATTLPPVRKVTSHGWPDRLSGKPHVVSMIHAWTSTVEDLNIIFAPWTSLDHIGMPVPSLDLGAFAHLRHLAIDFSPVHGSSLISLFKETGENIIPGLKSSQLQSLHISLPFSNIITSLNASRTEPQSFGSITSSDDYSGILELITAHLTNDAQFKNLENLVIQIKHEGIDCVQERMDYIVERHEGSGGCLHLRVTVEILVPQCDVLRTNCIWLGNCLAYFKLCPPDNRT